jgi:hypothetical protein
MEATFDPYLQWLAIRDPKRPPNHYRMLGIDPFESDPEVIQNAADRQMTHVRRFQSGQHWAESQRLLNELAAAKICLLNPEKKAAYDATLRAEGLPETRRATTPPPLVRDRDFSALPSSIELSLNENEASNVSPSAEEVLIPSMPLPLGKLPGRSAGGNGKNIELDKTPPTDFFKTPVFFCLLGSLVVVLIVLWMLFLKK